MLLEREKYFHTFSKHAKNVRELFDSLMRMSPTFNNTIFSLKCAAVGYAIGLLLFRRTYVPMVFGLGYGIGRNFTCKKQD